MNECKDDFERASNGILRGIAVLPLTTPGDGAAGRGRLSTDIAGRLEAKLGAKHGFLQ